MKVCYCAHASYKEMGFLTKKRVKPLQADTETNRTQHIRAGNEMTPPVPHFELHLLTITSDKRGDPERTP